MIADLMQPEDEARNEHKRMQLRELAALNGTLKARRCPLCWTLSMLSCDVQEALCWDRTCMSTSARAQVWLAILSGAAAVARAERRLLHEMACTRYRVVKLQEFEEQPCFLCGETGHRQWECPNTKEEGFKLSEEMQSKVQALYARDIARREVRPALLPALCLLLPVHCFQLPVQNCHGGVTACALSGL